MGWPLPALFALRSALFEGVGMSTEASPAWAGQRVEVTRIEEALREAWRAEAARAPEERGALAARTNVLNLIVHASSRGEVERVAAAIERLGVHHPSRTILILAEPGGAEAAIEAWVKVTGRNLGERRLLFEQVTLAARGEAALHLPATVDSLLISELPDFLWWLGEPPFSAPGFTRMVDIVDRLIVDSAAFANLAAGLHELAELTVVPQNAAISDFAWDRLRPWRELVAQFFDPPEHAASLETLEAIEISYEPTGTGPSAGLAEGILALGWACSRLGWFVGRPPARDDAGGWRWELRAGERTVAASLRPEGREDPSAGLCAVTLTAGGKAPGTFEVYREGGAHLATRVNVPGAPSLDSVMRATEPEGNDLLLHALGQFGRDRTFDGALVFAAQLSRGLGGGSR
jgi:glucose-6-phosphate dehydrogenase assembly protein OpcA